MLTECCNGVQEKTAKTSGGSSSLTSGGLGLWDGSSWSLVGGARVQGTVTCLAVAGQGEGGGGSANDGGNHLLYVAGRFSLVGQVQALNIAVFNHSSNLWSMLGGGLRARDVFALAVWPGVYSAEERVRHRVYAVGSISHAGDIVLGNIGMWSPDTLSWHPMRKLNGIVRGAAVMDSRLYVAGDFTVAGDEPAAAIAYTHIHDDAKAPVVWHQVGAGVRGNVHAVRTVGSCIYIGGRFDSVADHQGIKPANNVARWCTGKSANATTSTLHDERWEPVDGLEDAGATVLAIAPADPSV